MLSVKEVSIVYETLLASPGMNDTVKIPLNLTRKNALLLSKLIELGLSVKNENGQGGLLSIADPSALEELQGLSAEILKKAGLTDMNDRLNALQTK